MTQPLWTCIMILDASFMTHDINDDDIDTDDEFIALRNKSTPQFRYPPGLRSEGRGNRASSTRKEPGSPGKC